MMKTILDTFNQTAESFFRPFRRNLWLSYTWLPLTALPAFLLYLIPLMLTMLLLPFLMDAALLENTGRLMETFFLWRSKTLKFLPVLFLILSAALFFFSRFLSTTYACIASGETDHRLFWNGQKTMGNSFFLWSLATAILSAAPALFALLFLKPFAEENFLIASAAVLSSFLIYSVGGTFIFLTHLTVQPLAAENPSLTVSSGWKLLLPSLKNRSKELGVYLTAVTVNYLAAGAYQSLAAMFAFAALLLLLAPSALLIIFSGSAYAALALAAAIPALAVSAVLLAFLNAPAVYFLLRYQYLFMKERLPNFPQRTDTA